MIFKDKTIFVSGGTGSWGNELIRQLLEYQPKQIIIFSRGEIKQVEMLRKFNNPILEFVIGDVRDKHAVDMAMRRGVDYVFHLAALKHVPICENQPQEAIETNIIGTKNMINSAIIHGVRKFIDVSTDKACLASSSPIELSDGSAVSIRDFVLSRGTAKVKTLSNNGFVEGTVTNWFKNDRGNRAMIRLMLERSPRMGGKQFGLCLTEDHLVMTPDGWKEAGKFKDGDFVITSELAPNEKQMSLLVGTILGDSSISQTKFKGGKRPSNAKSYFHTGHSEKQKDWLFCVYRALKDFSTRPPNVERPGNRGGSKRTPFWILRFQALTYFSDLYRLFYCGEGGRKIVPRELVTKYWSPELLSAWYMDDGTRALNGNAMSRSQIRFETQGFCEDDVTWLAKFLTDKGYPSKPYRHCVSNKFYWQIRVSTNGADKIFKEIGRYIPPQLRYKIPDWADSYDEKSWDLGRAVPYISPIITKKVILRQNSVYCLDVEGTRNFCANGFIVHNCNPINLYGFTKGVGERLSIQANCLTAKTDFICIRGGNVLGTNGSVIPYIINQIKRNKEVLITDSRMTRFFLTIQEAIKLLFQATECGVGGETYVMNMPSFYIKDLVDVLVDFYGDGDVKIKEVGAREGEKIHEILISEHELDRTHYVNDDYFVIYPQIKTGRSYHHYWDDTDVYMKPAIPAHGLTSADNLRDKDYLRILLKEGGWL